MRSSPSCLAVNRRGLGVHLTMEKYSNENTLRTGSVYQEALAAASRLPKEEGLTKPRGKIKSRKVLILALFSLGQALVVLVNQVFDIVKYF